MVNIDVYKRQMQISELRAYINKIPNKVIHLVISSTIKNKDIKVILQGYGVIDFDSIIVTKFCLLYTSRCV